MAGLNRTEHLKLVDKEMRARRRSRPADGAAEQTHHVEDPNLVANAGQLQSLVKDDPNAVMLYIDDLRFQRDQFLEVAGWYKDSVATGKKIQNDLTEAVNTIEGLQEEIVQLQQKNNEMRLLQTRLGKKKTTQVAADQKDDSDADDDEAPSKQQKATKSTKLPDPPVFTDGVDPSWEDWSAKMEEKLDANVDWLPTAKSQLTYVYSRIGGNASKQTMTRRTRNCTNPYASYSEIMDDLADIYEDSDKKRNAMREYRALEQGTRPFMEFYAEFVHLAEICGYNESTKLHDMECKVRKGLQKAWRTVGRIGNFTTVKEVKDYLREVDNSERAEYQQQVASKVSTAKTTSPRKPVTTTRTTRAIPATETQTTTVKADPDPKGSTCFSCGKTGHVRKDCTLKTQNDAGKKAYYEAKINELMMEEDEMQDDDDPCDSSSDSGKE